MPAVSVDLFSVRVPGHALFLWTVLTMVVFPVPGDALVAWGIPERTVCAKIVFRAKVQIGKPVVSLTMDLLGSVFLIIVAIVVLIVLYYLLQDVITLVVNAVVGVIILFLLNLFHIMSLFGASDIPIDWITVLVSAIGGLVGVVIVVILHLAGVVL
jgi:hypothetical protein